MDGTKMKKVLNLLTAIIFVFSAPTAYAALTLKQTQMAQQCSAVSFVAAKNAEATGNLYQKQQLLELSNRYNNIAMIDTKNYSQELSLILVGRVSTMPPKAVNELLGECLRWSAAGGPDPTK